ncbi:MAG TPA: condensation domain-containing protein, partial [Actinomycetota bacterium]
AGTSLYLLDAALEPVPLGVAGELFIGGAGVARGYHGRPELTAERFVPDAFAGRRGAPGARLYRTGDLVRRDGRGRLEFLGRIDHQVKIRGFRIELGEIEAALAQRPEIGNAVVVAREDEPGHKRLVAYLVPAAGAQLPDTADLRAFLAQSLPDYMVPSAFVTLDELPLSPNGKLDRKALPAPDPGAAHAGGYVAPRTDAEWTLAGIWSEVLGVAQVGVEDNFFELGGDSILSIQVVSRARAAGLSLMPRDLFLHQSVASLAANVSEALPALSEQGTVVGPAPLTPIQHWLFETQAQSPEHFDQSVTVELAEDLDVDALRTALEALATHHDALRMRFGHVDGAWHQHNAPVESVGLLQRHDLSAAAPGEQDALMEQIAAAAHVSFDLGEGPLLKAVLFHLGAPARPQLFLAVHHLVVDGVSWRILLEDLDTAYRQAAGGQAIHLGPKTTSFRDWALALADHVASGGLDAELGYWAAATRGCDAALPLDRHGSNTIASTRQVTVALGPDDTRALLQDVPGTYRTQVNDVLLAALGRVLSAWSGRERVLVDLEGHGREDVLDGVDLSRTVGWFTTLFPVALDLAGDGSWAATLKSVKEQLRAVPGRGLGYGALRYLREGLPAAEALSAGPGPQVSFNYLGQFDWASASGQEGSLVRGMPGGLDGDVGSETTRPHVLDINGAVQGGVLELVWAYSAELHDEATVRRLAQDMIQALREIVAHCSQPGAGGRTPSDFPLARLDQASVDALVGDGRGVEDVYPLTPMQAGMLFHSLVDTSSGAYLDQIRLRLDGVSDPRALGEAWQRV